MCDIDNIGVQKKDMDDSGFVFDMSAQDVSMSARVSLMDLSDDVLLYILRFCAPRDLKALGYSCTRLGSLVLERSLWRHVDARSERCSRARLKWLLENALHGDTHVLMLTGYAKEADGCMGLINLTRKEAEREISAYNRKEAAAGGRSTLCEAIHEIPIPVHMDRMERHPARFFISAQRTPLPRHRCFPSWPDTGDEGRAGPQRCSGPQFTLSKPLLEQLSTNCPQLTTLVLEYCNIDCTGTSLGIFPKTLRKLSLRGTKCYNMTFDKSFLFRIQDIMPILESLDVSECDWMDPATLLPLSKMVALEELIMQDCVKLAEFVAYASLTARYGFRVLKRLDLRGSPVGDSEVSALGWLPKLEKLWLGARRAKRVSPHAHYTDDVRARHVQLHEWETCDLDDHNPNSNPNSSVEDMERGMGDVIPSSAINSDDPASANESSQSKDTKGKKDVPDEKDKKDGKRKHDDDGGDDQDGNGKPSCKRNRARVDISFENNSVRNNVLPVVRDVSDFFTFHENDESSSNGTNNGNKINENRENNANRENAEPNNERMNDNNFVPSNCPFNLLSPLASIDVGNVEIGFRVLNAENLMDNDENQNRDNPDGERDDANQEYRFRYNGNENGGNGPNVDNDPDDPNDPECLIDCIKIDQLIDVSEGSSGRQNEVIVIASTARPKSEASTSKPRPEGCVHYRHNQKPFYVNVNGEGRGEDVKMDENPSASDNNGGQKRNDAEIAEKVDKKKEDREKIDDAKPGPSGKGPVNEGASTSQDAQNNEDKEKYVLFRKNKNPVYVNCAPENVQRREPLPPVQYQIEPRHHVLYVGVGPQLNTYRFPRDSSELLRHLNFQPSHIDSSGLVTDFAMRRFGRADGEDVNIIHIGPDGPMLVGQAPGSRPDRSSLRFLSVTGYRHITDRSLMHLATAAPNLEFIDFSGTSVTENGVENFKGLRSDCDVVFSQYHNKDEGDK